MACKEVQKNCNLTHFQLSSDPTRKSKTSLKNEPVSEVLFPGAEFDKPTSAAGESLVLGSLHCVRDHKLFLSVLPSIMTHTAALQRRATDTIDHHKIGLLINT